MWSVGDRSKPFGMTTPADFGSFAALKEYALRVHGYIEDELTALTDAQPSEPVTIPWFKERPLAISRAEALMRSVMHSQWHRGQNATRLRELGITPPTVDLIVWFWLGKPSSKWS